MGIDFTGIGQAALSQAEKLVPGWVPGGHMEGNEYIVANPMRIDKNPGSFKINLKTGVWSDFGHDAGGSDLTSLYAYLFCNNKQSDAAKALGQQFGFPIDGQADQPHLRANFKPQPQQLRQMDEAPLPHVPDGTMEGLPAHREHGNAQYHWEYRNIDDKLMGYIARWDTADGDKTFAVRFHFADGWRWAGYKGQNPHPLYGMQHLKQRPNARVLIVEGEKTADAAQILFPDLVVLSWYGGTAKAAKVDMSPLAGRIVYFWPDFDGQIDKNTGTVLPAKQQTGTKAMMTMARNLMNISGENLFMIDYEPGDYVDDSGWDLADALSEGWTTEKARLHLKNNTYEIKPLPAPAIELPKPIIEKTNTTPAAKVTSIEKAKSKAPTVDRSSKDLMSNLENNKWFRPVGFLKADNRTQYAFWNKRSRSVALFKSSAMTLENLSELAPMSFWELMFGFELRQKELATMVREQLIQACYLKPIYDTDLIRGRGAWTDNGRIVVHLGDHLMVDGTPTALDAIESDHLYEGGHKLPLCETAATAEQGQAFVDLCQMFSWDRPVSALYLAGWCFLAPICGALPWRPHIWLNGPSAAGKSWINDNVIQQMLGRYILKAQSETTEAGIRQTLGSDALPVVFDEAESETTKADTRMQNVLALARQCSSETGGAILKGSADGNAKSYRIRSMFCWSSIVPSVSQHSDNTRIAMLGLHPQVDNESVSFDSIKLAYRATVTPEFAKAAHRRAADRIPMILEVFKMFSDELTNFISSRRLGDQYGMLLAGAWCLANDHLPSEQEVGDYLMLCDWSDETQVMEDHDGIRCLRMILERPVRIQNALGHAADSSIGELVSAIHKNQASSLVDFKDATGYLSRVGIKVSENCIYISNSHSALGQLLKETPWPRNWCKILRHIPGAIVPKEKKRFSDASPLQRCTSIPTSCITSDEQ